MKNKKSVYGIWVLAVVGLIFVSGCIKQQMQSGQEAITNEQNQLLPSSFTINFSGDFTSSGAGRRYTASLTFDREGLTRGWQRYEVWPGTGDSYSHECVIDMGALSWIDTETGENCSINVDLPLTHERLQESIDSRYIKPSDQCHHYDLCYSIVEEIS